MMNNKKLYNVYIGLTERPVMLKEVEIESIGPAFLVLRDGDTTYNYNIKFVVYLKYTEIGEDLVE